MIKATPCCMGFLDCSLMARRSRSRSRTRSLALSLSLSLSLSFSLSLSLSLSLLFLLQVFPSSCFGRLCSPKYGRFQPDVENLHKTNVVKCIEVSAPVYDFLQKHFMTVTVVTCKIALDLFALAPTVMISLHNGSKEGLMATLLERIL